MGLYSDKKETTEKEINSPPADKKEETAPATEEGAPPPKRRGRPPGSKNKVGAAVNKDGTVSIDLGNIPQEVIEPLALAPQLILKMAVAAKTTIKDANGRVEMPGIVLQYDEKACIGSVAAFRKWLSSIDFDLTPGWAYIACTTLSIASAAPLLFAELGERREVMAKKKHANPEAMSKPPENKETVNAPQDEKAGAGNDNGASPKPDSAS